MLRWFGEPGCRKFSNLGLVVSEFLTCRGFRPRGLGFKGLGF